MIQTVATPSDPAFRWTDVVDPTRAELESVSEQHGLPAMAVADCLDPEHLPKHERLGDRVFLIVRAFDEQASGDAVTVHELTRKVAIFAGPGFLVSVHRKPQPYLAAVQARWQEPTAGACEPDVLVALVAAAVDSFGPPLEDAEARLESFEASLFGREPDFTHLEDIHRVKRRVAVAKRMLWLTLQTLHRLQPAAPQHAPLFQDLRESAEGMYYYADDLLEGSNHLLSMQLAMASHRTNEVMRVLTIFSAFFLPLTFLVGVYGMNFDVMPELRWRTGYALVWVLMLGVTGGTYLWFRRRGWLR